ncbi:MAG: efflux RND transporter periplasmic adaptor subunit [Planctomycetia bacterium]|nr:efflux RND transporter periplasmic adaptor subunit [Planctomycetia bacterium]
MMRTLHVRLACAALALLAGLLAVGSGCGRRAAPVDAKPATAEGPLATLTVVDVTPRVWPQTVRIQGTLVEDESAALGAKVSGRVREVLVELGTRVDKGQPIARLDTEEFDLRVKQAEAQVAQARASLGLKGDARDEDLDPREAAPVLQELALLEDARLNVERAHRLTGRAGLTQAVLTQEEVQARESALRVAEARHAAALNSVHEHQALLALRRAELALAQQNREDAILKAPFVGVIQQRHVAPGSYVTVGQMVVTLVRIDPLRFRAGVPERAATGLALGQKVRIFLEGVPDPIEARIDRISPALDVSSRALVIEADVKNAGDRWRSGLFAEGEIVFDARQQALAVPVTSVVTFGGMEKVWIVKDDKAAPRPVRIGRREGRFLEVLGGLQAGDVVLSNGQQGREGIVRVRREGADNSDDHAALLGQ